MTGKTLGPYKILEQLGRGGMGEVWLAEDTRLDRKVAVKVLPAELAGDTDRRQRFEQEAKAAAALNHPNIAAIHDVGVEDAEGTTTHFMVQEYLQGETVRETLARGPLPFNKALTLAVEIGEALKAAHRAGIVHRDLKPENVFVTQDGHAKVLDFGLAKLTEFALPAGGGPSMSPTMTMAGQILGTAGYMSPEQVRGEEVDERADLFALGCVLYEMLTARQAFGGSNVHESLSRVLTAEPEAISHGSGASAPFGWLLGKLLAKDRDERYQSAADAVVDLRRLASSPESDATTRGGVEPATPAGTEASKRVPRSSLVLLVAIALAIGGVGAWMLKPGAESPPAQDLRFDIMLPQGKSFSSNYNRVTTISPDSRVVVYLAEGLYLRSLDEIAAREVPNTETARSPAFSPDSRQVAFWESERIKRVAIDGGTPVVVTSLTERPMGIHWASDDHLYVGRADLGIWKVPASGGELEQVVALNEGEYAHGPELLPGGEWVLYSLSRAVRAWMDGSIVAQSLATKERRVLVQRGREVRVTANGYLTYVQDMTLFAAPFDAERIEITGAAVAMEANVHTSGEDETGAAGYDISDDGVLVFAPPAGMGARLSSLNFLDRDGRETLLPAEARRYAMARLSPDGNRIAAQINDVEGTHIWVISVDRESGQRLTSEGRNTFPVWSDDGRHVYFASDRGGSIDIWRRAADLSTRAEQVLESEGAELPTAASDDGRWLYYSLNRPGDSDVGRVSLDGKATVEMLVASSADENHTSVAPGGEFIAFQSEETGRWDVHVMEIATGRRWIVSNAEGYFPLWTRDGKQIIFRAGGAAVSVEVQTTPDFSAGDPILAFDIDASRQGQTHDVSRDGERILLGLNALTEGRSESRPRVTVDMSWFDRIDERVGQSR